MRGCSAVLLATGWKLSKGNSVTPGTDIDHDFDAWLASSDPIGDYGQLPNEARRRARECFERTVGRVEDESAIIAELQRQLQTAKEVCYHPTVMQWVIACLKTGDETLERLALQHERLQRATLGDE
jgi:hypothetical protein